MEVARTPDERFANLPGYPFEPHYVEIPSGAASGVATLRVHYVDEGPKDAAETIVCMHGMPSWSFLYRKMVPHFVAAGHRVLCPDLVGFGRSDKPTKTSDYTYEAHVRWMEAWLHAVNLQNITLVCQDWGGLIGLRVLARNEARFARICTANTGLPAGDIPGLIAGPLRRGYEALPVPTEEDLAKNFHRTQPAVSTLLRMILFRRAPPPDESLGFFYWIKWTAESPSFTVRTVFAKNDMMGGNALSDDVVGGYGAPFPDEDKEKYLAGPRQLPSLVPVFQDGGFRGVAQDVEDNKAAWEVLYKWQKPFLCAFSDKDPVFADQGAEFQKRVPAAKKTEHLVIKGGGHYLQEDNPDELAAAVLEFIAGKRQKA